MPIGSWRESSLSPSIIRQAHPLPRSYRNDKDMSDGEVVASGNLVGIGMGSISRHTDKSEALFTTENSTVVIAQRGSTANLPCVVRNLGNGVVSVFTFFFPFSKLLLAFHSFSAV